MSATVIAILISAGGLIISIVTQMWLRAVSQGETRQTILGLTGNVAKLIEWNNDRVEFQARTSEFIVTQRSWNSKTETRVENISERQNQMQGREDGRRG